MEPLKQDTLFSKCQEKLPQPARYLCREWEFIGAATAEQTQCCHNQAKAGLHFAFGALAVASHFIPAFSQATDGVRSRSFLRNPERTRLQLVLHRGLALCE